MFTIPTIVTSEDLSKRSYVTFYFEGRRVREYNGNSLNLKIYPNHGKTMSERKKLLELLRFELHKALDRNSYPATVVLESNKKSHATTQKLLFYAIKSKIKSDLSRTYKRDLKMIYREFRDFLLSEEANGPITDIKTSRIELFLTKYSSSGTYYMNKRRNLGVLFSSAGRSIDLNLKTVNSTPRRKAKSKLHAKYEIEQLKPLFNFLKAESPNLYLCCLLTYGTWLRPHEEIRLLTAQDFKNEMTEIHLTGNENKSGKVRVVYVPDYIRSELESVLSSIPRNANIFTHTTTPFNYSYFNTLWSRQFNKMIELGLVHENQTIYSFRHTAAVNLYNKTKDVYLLQKLLGHSTIVVTLKYLRNLGEVDTEILKQAAPTLEFD